MKNNLKELFYFCLINNINVFHLQKTFKNSLSEINRVPCFILQGEHFFLDNFLFIHCFLSSIQYDIFNAILCQVSKVIKIK